MSSIGEGMATLAHRGLSKILEDRAEFEVVADIPPDSLREKSLHGSGRAPQDAPSLGPGPSPVPVETLVLQKIAGGAEDEARARSPRPCLRTFAMKTACSRSIRRIDAQRLVDRYNVGLAQSVLLKSVQVEAEVRNEKPARYRQLFRQLKFHRLLYRVEGSMADGFLFHIDGPLSLFSATNKYGLQMALFLPALLLCRDFRLDAELRWGPKRDSRTFHLSANDGLVSHYADTGTHVPAELLAFIDRFRQVAPGWEVSEATNVLELGREGVWVPDYKFTHKATNIEVYVDIVGFWKKSSLERLLKLLPEHGPPRYLLAISDRLKVDEATLGDLAGPVLRFKEIPNASELATLLDGFLSRTGRQLPLR